MQREPLNHSIINNTNSAIAQCILAQLEQVCVINFVGLGILVCRAYLVLDTSNID